MSEIFFFKNHAENNVGRLDQNLFLFFIKAVYQVKAIGQHHSFNIFWLISTWVCNKNKLYITFWTVDPNFSVWLPLPLEILGNMCITIILIYSVTSLILKLTLALLPSCFPT